MRGIRGWWEIEMQVFPVIFCSHSIIHPIKYNKTPKNTEFDGSHPEEKKNAPNKTKKHWSYFGFVGERRKERKIGAKNHENVLSFTDEVMNRPERAQPKSANYCLKIWRRKPEDYLVETAPLMGKVEALLDVSIFPLHNWWSCHFLYIV